MMEVRATMTRKGWPRRREDQIPVRAWRGGERRREREAGWGVWERTW